MRRVLALALLAFLGSSAAPGAPAAGSADDEIDRLESLARAKPRESAEALVAVAQRLAPGRARLRALALAGSGYVRVAREDRVQEIARRIEQGGDDPAWSQAAATLLRAQWQDYHGDVRQAEHLLIEVTPRIEADAPAFLRMRLLMSYADIETREQRYDEALRHYDAALALAEASRCVWRRVDVRGAMAGMFQQAGQPERAQRLNDEAMALAASAGDDVGLSDGYTMRALLADGRDDAAMLAAWQAAIEHARRAGSQQQWMLGLANLADYELSHGQFQLAYETSQRAIGLAREQGNEGTLSVGLANAGLALISLHRKEEGLALVRESMDIDERTGTMADAATNERELGLYLEQAGYLADALAAYQRSRALRDEEAVKESDHRLLEAEESLDNARRAHELALLEREGRLQEARLQQRSLEVRAWAAASAAGVLSVLVLLLFVGRQRGRNRRLAEANEALRFQAETDPLTGLTNRRHLQALCAERCTGRPLEAAYLIDLDHFRRVNQQAGHAGGDAVLAEVARRLRATVREGDIVARWGGEEFVVLSAQPSAASAHGLAARLLAAVSRAPVPYGAHALSVTASVGYVFLGEAPGAGLEGALAVADAAMYDVKRRGRDGICGVELVQPADLASVAASLEAAQADGRVVLRR